MSRRLIKCANQLGFAFLLIASFNQAFSQQSSVATLGKSGAGLDSDNPAKPKTRDVSDQAAILANFVAAENKIREALNQHTFKRDVVLQTIGPNGEVTGEYLRNSQFVFDDRGRRIERVLFRPASTIRELRITREDIQDLAGAQLLGIDIVEAARYHLTYVGVETIDSRQLIAVDVGPRTEPNPHRMSDRFFVGRVWLDPTTFQIARIKGTVEPHGKQRFPIFETWREPIRNALAFPTRTEADDVLHFQERDVHYRIKVRYHDYRLFASKISIKEIDQLPLDSSETLPKTKSPPRRNEAAPKIKEAPARMSQDQLDQLTLHRSGPPKKEKVCTTNRNAPPAGAYHWPADTEIKVYFGKNMFTPEQSAALLEAMKAWTSVEQEAGSGVRFLYAGLTETLMSCQSCLTVKRRAVHANDKQHYAFFHPMKQAKGRLLFSAWIDLDFGIVDSQALRGFMAHELGHGLGLMDCPSCKKKQSLMNSFPGINRNNGLIAPSICDLATMKNIYQLERHIAATLNLRDKVPAPVRADSTLALPGRPVLVP